jgi:ankyrin repeat protein
LLTVGEPVVNKDLRSRLFCDAVECGRADIVKFLYDFKREEAPWDFTLGDDWIREGQLVHWGARTPSLEVLKFFEEELHRLNHNADTEKWQLDSELCVCAGAGRLETVEYLLGKGAKADWRYDTEKRRLRVPLQDAAMGNHSAVVDLLLQHGADAQAAIGNAVLSGRTAIVQILLRAGAAPDDYLSTAASRGYWDMVRVLLDAGVDVNECIPDESPLVWAIMREHTTMFNFVLERGANLHAEGTAEECVRRAKKDGLESTLQLLEANGVNVEEVE